MPDPEELAAVTLADFGSPSSLSFDHAQRHRGIWLTVIRSLKEIQPWTDADRAGYEAEQQRLREQAAAFRVEARDTR